jgi:hypothetical protein
MDDIVIRRLLVDIQITVVGKFITDHEGLEPRYRWISILS